jgi:hypothetical protein
MNLTILCISKIDRNSLSFINAMHLLAINLHAQFVLANNGNVPFDYYGWINTKVVRVKSLGYLESSLEEAVAACDGDYILRLDDDEAPSPAMVDWLYAETWQERDHWKFPRMHLWDRGNSVLLTPHLFPDYQTRLSTKEKSGGRTTVHAGSPFGGGALAPVSIEHHKFLMKDYATRAQIAAVYDDFSPGYGTGNMIPFSLPEDAYKGQVVQLVAPWTGEVPWTPRWVREEQW